MRGTVTILRIDERFAVLHEHLSAKYLESEPYMTFAQENPSFDLLATHERTGFSIRLGIDRSVKRFSRYQIVISLHREDDAPNSAYSFEGKLDEFGAQKIGELLEEGGALSDPALLTRLLAITKAHSCEDWVFKPGSHAKRAGAVFPEMPDFEQFARDPNVAGLFFLATYTDRDRDLIMESALAPWGEFLTLRVLQSSSKWGQRQELAFFKVLLPPVADRVYSKAFAELRTLLERATLAFTSLGVAGLIEMLKQASVEVLRYSEKMESAHIELEEDVEESCYKLTHSDPGAATTVELRIGAEFAKVSVTSDYDDVKTGLAISFQPGAGVKEFTAAQIRAMRGFFRFIAYNEMPTNPQGVLEIVSRLMLGEQTEARREGQLSLGNEQGALGERSLSLLTVTHSVRKLGPHYFLPRHRCRGLNRSSVVFMEGALPITPDTLGDIMLGGRILSLRLREHIALRRPDLIASLMVTSYPDGRVGIRVENGMRGRFSVKMQRDLTATPSARLQVLERLYDAFECQVDLGCSHFLKFVQSLGDEPLISRLYADGAASAPNLPMPQDVSAVANFELAGRLLSLVSRDPVPGFWSFCTDAGNGSISLAMGSSYLTGALEARFVNSRLEQLVVRSRELVTNTSPWETREAFTYDDLIIESSELFDLVTSIRTFFRDLIRATAADISSSKDLVFDSFAESVRLFARSSS